MKDEKILKEKSEALKITLKTIKKKCKKIIES